MSINEEEAEEEFDRHTAQVEHAMKALAIIEAELAQIEHIPPGTWNKLHVAFDKVRVALQA